MSSTQIAEVIRTRVSQFEDWASVPIGTFVKKLEDGSLGFEEVYTKEQVDQKIAEAISEANSSNVTLNSDGKIPDSFLSEKILRTR